MIGILLIAVSGLLAIEVKSLLVGEAAGGNYREAIQASFSSRDPKMKIIRFISLVVGNNEIMITLKVLPGSKTLSADLIDTINAVEVEMKAKFPELKWLFIEPDVRD